MADIARKGSHHEEEDGGCFSCITDKIDIPPPPDYLPEGFAQSKWDEIGQFDCCTYRNAELGFPLCRCCSEGSYCRECTWCPAMLQAVQSPCIIFGQIVTALNQEEHLCCSMCCGKKGLGACCCLCPFVVLGGFPPASPLQFSFVAAFLAFVQRKRLYLQYGLDQSEASSSNSSPCLVFCCYPCTLWKHYTFISQIEAYKKCDDAEVIQVTMGSVSAGSENPEENTQAAAPAAEEREPTCWINGQPVYEDTPEEDVTKMRA